MRNHCYRFIAVAAFLSAALWPAYGQQSMSFEVRFIYRNDDSAKATVTVENTGPTNFLLNSIQFMLTYDPAELTVDSAKTITNHRFSVAGWISSSNALYSNLDHNNPDTLFYKEVSPSPDNGVTIPRNVSLVICTLMFFKPAWSLWMDYNLGLIGNNFVQRLSGFTTIQNGYSPFSPVIGAKVILSGDPVDAPLSSALHPCYPNPVGAGAATEVLFSLGAPARVRLAVHNALGQSVATITEGDFSPGTHNASWAAAGMPPGMYFIVMETYGNTPGTSARYVRALAVR